MLQTTIQVTQLPGIFNIIDFMPKHNNKNSMIFLSKMILRCGAEVWTCYGTGGKLSEMAHGVEFRWIERKRAFDIHILFSRFGPSSRGGRCCLYEGQIPKLLFWPLKLWYFLIKIKNQQLYKYNFTGSSLISILQWWNNKLQTKPMTHLVSV